MKSILFLFLVLITYFTSAQSFSKITDTEFENATFESLDYLIEDLKDIKLIGLGEALHFMGGTYTAKIKMIKFLHQKCGFDVLAFEGPMYNLSIVGEQVKNKIATKDTIRKNLPGVWSTPEMMELYEYIIETQNTERPLEFIGFDELFWASQENQNLPKDYAKFISKLEKKINKNIELDSTFYNAINLTANNSYSFAKRSPQDTLLMFNKFKEIRFALEEFDYRKNNYFYYWKLNTDNLQSVYRKSYKKSNRDKQMAMNAIFLAENIYPDKKIILWGATTHFIANPNAIVAFEQSEKLNKNMMGVFLRDHFKDKYYMMAFTPRQGKTGVKGYLGLMKVKVRSRKRSIEKYIDETYKTNFALVPLRSEEVKNEISENDLIKSNIVWAKGARYNGDEMDISNSADAIFYLKNEHLIDFKKFREASQK